MIDDVKITNTKNNVSYEIRGKTWEKLLELTYKRSKTELFETLKNVTEVLEQEKFNYKRVKDERKW